VTKANKQNAIIDQTSGGQYTSGKRSNRTKTFTKSL